MFGFFVFNQESVIFHTFLLRQVVGNSHSVGTGSWWLQGVPRLTNTLRKIAKALDKITEAVQDKAQQGKPTNNYVLFAFKFPLLSNYNPQVP